MPSKDLHSKTKEFVALTSQTISTDTTTYGEIIDILGYESLEFFLLSGTLTDGAYAVTLQQGDDSGLSDAADVPAAESLPDSIAFALTDDDEVKRIGTVGKKRYARLKIVSTGTSSGGVFAGVAVLSNPHHGPVADSA